MTRDFPNTEIGFIGIGKLGFPLAKRLSEAGLKVNAYDIQEKYSEKCDGTNITFIKNLEYITKISDIFFLCLPGPDEIKNLLLERNDFVGLMKKNTFIIDHSTGDPRMVETIVKELKPKSIRYIDVPVSGGVEAAVTGKLTALVGSKKTYFDLVRPYLKLTCSTIVHTGKPGTATLVKLLNNLACFTLDQVLAECLTIGRKAGLDSDLMYQALRSSAIGSGGNINIRVTETFMKNDFNPRFMLKHARKDVGLALDLAKDLEVPLRIVPLCLEEIDEAISRGFADKDASVAMSIQEERSNVRVRPY